MGLIRHLLTRYYLRGRQGERRARKIMRICLERQGIGTAEHVATSAEIEAALSCLQRSDPIVFDVGANVGLYATLLTRRLPEGQIHCFEPHPDTFGRLHTNLAGTGIVLNQFGLSDKERSATLFAQDEISGLASLYDRRLDHHGLALSDRYSIRLERLDQYVDRHAIPRIDLLKIDAEGHELKVLQGAAKSFQRGIISAVQFEFGGCNIDSRTFFQDFYYFFKNHGFRLYRISPDGLIEIGNYHESLEQFCTTNYLALKTIRPEC